MIEPELDNQRLLGRMPVKGWLWAVKRPLTNILFDYSWANDKKLWLMELLSVAIYVAKRKTRKAEWVLLVRNYLGR